MEIYLAGAMEKAVDHGLGWRVDVAKKLRDLDFKVHSPGEVETTELGENGFADHAAFHAAKGGPDHERYLACMRQIMDLDLEAISNLDGILVYIDRAVISYAGGTVAELTYAYHDMGMPVIAVLDPDLTEKDVPGWMLACCTKIVPTFDAAIKEFQTRQKDRVARNAVIMLAREVLAKKEAEKSTFHGEGAIATLCVITGVWALFMIAIDLCHYWSGK